MEGTKFLDRPADRNEGRESKSTLARNSLCASAKIDSSD